MQRDYLDRTSFQVDNNINLAMTESANSTAVTCGEQDTDQSVSGGGTFSCLWGSMAPGLPRLPHDCLKRR